MKKFRLYWFPSILSVGAALYFYARMGGFDEGSSVSPIMLAVGIIVIIPLVFFAVSAHMRTMEEKYHSKDKEVEEER